MKNIFTIFLVLATLLFGTGCVNTGNTPESPPLNETSSPVVYYESENLSIPVEIAQIDTKDPENFTANVTSVLSTILTDQRAGLLLQNSWNVTSVRQYTDEQNQNRTYVTVEFQKERLSFFIDVDEGEHRTLEGYCGAPWWIAEPISGPLPEDYHQATDKCTQTYHVFDQKNNRTVMIYNKTTIFYLYPSYSIPLPGDAVPFSQ